MDNNGWHEDFEDSPAVEEASQEEHDAYEARRAWTQQQPPMIESLDHSDEEDTPF